MTIDECIYAYQVSSINKNRVRDSADQIPVVFIPRKPIRTSCWITRVLYAVVSSIAIRVGFWTACTISSHNTKGTCFNCCGIYDGSYWMSCVNWGSAQHLLLQRMWQYLGLGNHEAWYPSFCPGNNSRVEGNTPTYISISEISRQWLRGVLKIVNNYSENISSSCCWCTVRRRVRQNIFTLWPECSTCCHGSHFSWYMFCCWSQWMTTRMAINNFRDGGILWMKKCVTKELKLFHRLFHQTLGYCRIHQIHIWRVQSSRMPIHDEPFCRYRTSVSRYCFRFMAFCSCSTGVVG